MLYIVCKYLCDKTIYDLLKKFKLILIFYKIYSEI